MGTLAVNRKGFITGAVASSFADAHQVSTGVASDSTSGNQSNCIQYFQSSGRGSTFRFTRVFLHFDTSGISAGSSFVLVLTGNTNADANVVALKHTAGSSAGGELANADFDNIDRNTPYSSATAWSTNSQVSMSLNAAAATQIINNSHFNVALIGVEDFNAEEESPLEEDGDISRGIAFNSAINLTYTDAASGFTHKINGLASASIGKINTVATASIGKVNTVD